MMALSKSLPSGQVPMLCQMCEKSSEIRWKCLLCDFLLCTKCQKLHKKVKSTDQHTIIDIKDIGTYQQEVSNPPDINNMPCSVHNGQNCCLFCQTCEEVICPLCILQAHKTQKMIGLAEGYKSTLKTVKDFHTEVEENILQTVKGLSKLGLMETSEKSKYESERQTILDRERVLKNEVEKHTQNILTEFDHQRDFFKKSVQDEQNRSKNIKKDLEIRRESLGHTLSQNKAYEVFSIFKQERALRAVGKQEVKQAITKFKGLPKYVPGKRPFLETQHGELIELKDENEQDTFEFQVLQKFKTKLPIVDDAVWCEDATLWISYFFLKRYRRYN